MPAGILGGLGNLATLRDARSRRASSWDTTGGNADFWLIRPGETRTLADLRGPGCVRHIWMTTMSREDAYLRRGVFRMYWDGAATPCVEAPLGDFFGVGHGMMAEFWSQPLSMSPRDGRGFNCFFPMPFAESGRIDITNDGERRLICYFYVDYEEYDRPQPDAAYFHAQWRRENPTDGWGKKGEPHTNARARGGVDAPEPRGRGQLRHPRRGRPRPLRRLQPQHRRLRAPAERLVRRRRRHDLDRRRADAARHRHGGLLQHGVLSGEDVLRAVPRPHRLLQGTDVWPWSGKNSMYRCHIEDPIHFRESIKVTIEHGHANDLSNDYSSTAYWYQLEPHAPPYPSPPPPPPPPPLLGEPLALLGPPAPPCCGLAPVFVSRPRKCVRRRG